MGSRIIALSYNFSLDYTLNFQQRRFGTVAVSVEAVPKVPTPRVRKSAVCDAGQAYCVSFKPANGSECLPHVFYPNLHFQLHDALRLLRHISDKKNLAYMHQISENDMDVHESYQVRQEVLCRSANYYCAGGRIHGAVKMAGVWLIPKTAEKPMDARTKDFRKIDK